MASKKDYDINYQKLNCRQFRFVLNKERDRDMIAFLEKQTNINGYLKELVRKEMKTMRNEQLLQNYAPSLFRLCLSGKETNTIRITDDMRTRDYWMNLFSDAIEDLKNGCTINGKGEKNDIAYWQKQIRLLDEFEPK